MAAALAGLVAATAAADWKDWAEGHGGYKKDWTKTEIDCGNGITIEVGSDGGVDIKGGDWDGDGVGDMLPDGPGAVTEDNIAEIADRFQKILSALLEQERDITADLADGKLQAEKLAGDDAKRRERYLRAVYTKAIGRMLKTNAALMKAGARAAALASGKKVANGPKDRLIDIAKTYRQYRHANARTLAGYYEAIGGTRKALQVYQSVYKELSKKEQAEAKDLKTKIDELTEALKAERRPAVRGRDQAGDGEGHKPRVDK